MNDRGGRAGRTTTASKAGRSTGERASGQVIGWAVVAIAVQPPQQPGDQLVVYERENKDYILYKEKERREKENKANGRVY